jgi:hypothetical protein
MSHTPGPWHAEIGPQGGYVISDDERGHTICLRSPWPMRMGESEANARLIAAAPELLAALEEVDRWRMQSLDMMPPEIRGAWMRAHAAIAKSQGGHP